MALFNVKAFEADADVLGKLRTVAFDSQGTLHIAGLDVAEAKQILAQCATGLTVETFDGSQAHAYAPAPVSGPPTTPTAADPKPAAAKGKSRGKGKAKAGNGAADPAEAVPAPAADNVVALNPGAAADAPEDAAEAPTGEELVAQAASKTKLKDVILLLRDGGFDDVDKLVAECTRIKEQVPVLAKIANIEDRVKRVWERLSA